MHGVRYNLLSLSVIKILENTIGVSLESYTVLRDVTTLLLYTAMPKTKSLEGIFDCLQVS